MGKGCCCENKFWLLPRVWLGQSNYCVNTLYIIVAKEHRRLEDQWDMTMKWGDARVFKMGRRSDVIVISSSLHTHSHIPSHTS